MDENQVREADGADEVMRPELAKKLYQVEHDHPVIVHAHQLGRSCLHFPYLYYVFIKDDGQFHDESKYSYENNVFHLYRCVVHEKGEHLGLLIAMDTI